MRTRLQRPALKDSLWQETNSPITHYHDTT